MRIKGLSNERYAERREAIDRALKKAYDGDLVFTPEDQAFVDKLDRAAAK